MLAIVVKRADEFFFLEGLSTLSLSLRPVILLAEITEIIGWEQGEQQPLRRSKKSSAVASAGVETGASPLSRFVHVAAKVDGGEVETSPVG